MADCKSCPSNSSCGKDNKAACNVVNNPYNKIKHVIGVMSGKGGVGKSTVSVLLAQSLNRQGYKVGILDADVTGPSVPRLLGIQHASAKQNQYGLLPIETEDGIKAMSLNFLLENEDEPVIWRGAIISNTVKQFYTDVLWGDLDYLVIDMPPGTGDVALTIMQSLPLAGIVMVTLPQDMVSMIVTKAVKMVQKMEGRILGVVQNMSYIECDACDHVIRIFEDDVTASLAAHNLELLGELPMRKEIVQIGTHGTKDLSQEIVEKLNHIANRVVDKTRVLEQV